MAPQILLPLLALHHDLYPVLLHLTLLHLAGMVSGLGTVIIYLALDYLFNKSLCSFLQFVYLYSTLFSPLLDRCDLFFVPLLGFEPGQHSHYAVLVRIPVGARDFSSRQNVQTSSGAHPTFH